jgi:hypothetical protein
VILSLASRSKDFYRIHHVATPEWDEAEVGWRELKRACAAWASGRLGVGGGLSGSRRSRDRLSFPLPSAHGRSQKAAPLGNTTTAGASPPNPPTTADVDSQEKSHHQHARTPNDFQPRREDGVVSGRGCEWQTGAAACQPQQHQHQQRQLVRQARADGNGAEREQRRPGEPCSQAMVSVLLPGRAGWAHDGTPVRVPVVLQVLEGADAVFGARGEFWHRILSHSFSPFTLLAV